MTVEDKFGYTQKIYWKREKKIYWKNIGREGRIYVFLVPKIANSCSKLERKREMEKKRLGRGKSLAQKRAGGIENRTWSFLDFGVEAALCDLVETIEEAWGRLAQNFIFFYFACRDGLASGLKWANERIWECESGLDIAKLYRISTRSDSRRGWRAVGFPDPLVSLCNVCTTSRF